MSHSTADLFSPTKTCSVETRRDLLQQWCAIDAKVHSVAKVQRVDQLTPNALMEVTAGLLVDRKHKVLLCSIAKSGWVYQTIYVVLLYCHVWVGIPNDILV